MEHSSEPGTHTGLARVLARRRMNVSSGPFSVRAGAWGLLAGLAGSLCCLGPSAAVLLGLGSASALAGFQLDRTLALAGGVALLIGGAALALRPGRACDTRPVARWRRLVLMLATSVLAYGLLGLLLPQMAASQVEATEAPPQLVVVPAAAPAAAPTLRRATLIIEKMDCPPCARNVRGLLARKPFVQAFTADAGNQQVIVDYDSRQIDAQRLAHLFPLAYHVTLISDDIVQ